MNADRLVRLTDKQRQCLRLVYAHMSSKEIAPILGVEPGTVDQYVKAAMRILGVSDRRHAARMLAEHEAATGQPLEYQSPAIAPDPESGEFRPSTGGGQQAPSQAVREEPAVFGFFPPPAPSLLPLPIGGRKPSDFGIVKRLGSIVLLILLIALAFGLFLAGFEALSRLGRPPG